MTQKSPQEASSPVQGKIPPVYNGKLITDEDDQQEIVQRDFSAPAQLLIQLGLWFPLDSSVWDDFHFELTSKTRKIKRMRFVDTGDQTPIATLTDFTVAATKGTDPQTGKPLLWLGMDYRLTSHGYRIFDGYDGGPMAVQLNFRSSAGGIVYQHRLSPGVKLACGHNNFHVTNLHAERYWVDWFDPWQKLDRDGWGTVEQC
ncbi:hypothetical protein [Streptomyces albipurpureus]|uniref:Uncharacterized protein n=1 Tax=Streptomyces albipurpureus TaxID=2897419 RepID=A0ABT0UND4_9ACTN|nr:hypothetical protein [Streptomyces sp. CWNU-1]MCM2389736.1 hypothetical protein [Streptomyces sp. CWNU-1]